MGNFQWFYDNQGVIFGEERGVVGNRDCGDFRGVENDPVGGNEGKGEGRSGGRGKRVEMEGKGEGSIGNILDLERSVAGRLQIDAAEGQNGGRSVQNGGRYAMSTERNAHRPSAHGYPRDSSESEAPEVWNEREFPDC